MSVDIGGSTDRFFPTNVPRFTPVHYSRRGSQYGMKSVRAISAPRRRASGFVGNRSRENGQGVTPTE